MRSSKRFPPNSALMLATPVMFPPGRAKLAMSPAPTGSAMPAKTMGDRPGRLLRGKRRWRSWGDDNVRLETDQLGRKLGQSLDPPARKSDFDGNVLPLDVAELAQPLPEGVELCRGSR